MIELCANSCYPQKRNCSSHKSLNCPECAQLSVMYCSVHETCEERFFLHLSVAFFIIYDLEKESENHPMYDIFSVLSVLLCRTRSTKISI